jgi:hypothetical protein
MKILGILFWKCTAYTWCVRYYLVGGIIRMTKPPTMGWVVHGASCLCGELSMGRAVHGASCPWGKLSWGELSWGEFWWGELYEESIFHPFQHPTTALVSTFLSSPGCSSGSPDITDFLKQNPPSRGLNSTYEPSIRRSTTSYWIFSFFVLTGPTPVICSGAGHPPWPTGDQWNLCTCVPQYKTWSSVFLANPFWSISFQSLNSAVKTLRLTSPPRIPGQGLVSYPSCRGI